MSKVLLVNGSSRQEGNTSVALAEVAAALEGHGILMRAEWDIRQHLRSGRLVQVLPGFHTPDADIYAVYPQQARTAARVRAFVDHLRALLPAGN